MEFPIAEHALREPDAVLVRRALFLYNRESVSGKRRRHMIPNKRPYATDEELLRNADHLRAEIEEFNKEKERIKRIMSGIGGRRSSRVDLVINLGLLLMVAGLFALEMVTHLIPTLLSIEIGILLVSFKIIWMMHTLQKATHFQFWVLSSMEFRTNQVQKQLASLEETVRKQCGKDADD